MGLNPSLRLTGFALMLGLAVFVVYRGWQAAPAQPRPAAAMPASAEAVEVAPNVFIEGHGLLGDDCRIVESDEAAAAAAFVFALEGGPLERARCMQIKNIQPFLDGRVGRVTLMSNGDYRVAVGGMRYVITDALDSMFHTLWRVHGRISRQTEQPLVVDLRYTAGSAIRPATL